MRVLKRNGNYEDVDLNKITRRISKLKSEISMEDHSVIDPIVISQKVCASLYDGITTSELDTLASEIAIGMGTLVPEYSTLAAFIVVSDLQKEVSKQVSSFSECIKSLYNNGFIDEKIANIVDSHEPVLNSAINHTRDYGFDYFAMKTLIKGYLQCVDGKVVETPQYMFMRVSLGIHHEDIESAIETYNLMSQKYFTHATPTLFNSASKRPQMASCFLLAMQDDSIKGIYNTLSDCAQISKWAGGIGLHIHNIRSRGSSINNIPNVGTGIVPMLKIFNDTARYVNQNGKRPGSIAIYLQVDHPDIFSFLDLRKNTGDEEERARDLFYAIWVPDLFMEKVKKKEQWCLFDPHKCPGLADVYGEEYETLYAKYESEEKYNQKIDAQDLWMAICTAQIETGTPYILYKDACNKKSNQQNVGTIKSSNLCVSGDTLILTNKGYENIKSLENKAISVWNGTQFSSTVVKCTGKNQQLYEVKTTYGRSLKCTEYHKFYLKNGTTPVSLNQLKVGDKLCRAEFPTIDSGKSMNTPYTHGLFCADGTISKMSSGLKHQCNYKVWNDTNFCKRHQNRKAVYTNDENQCNSESFTDQKILYLYDEKKELLPHLSYVSCSFAKNRINLQLDDNIENKYFVPINYNIHTKLQWLAGLCDGDGCIVKYDKIKNIQISSIHKNFLQEVVYLLHTLGVQIKMSTSQKRRRTQMPKNDGSGEHKLYDCHELYRISIDAKSLIHLQSLGFKTHRLNIDNCKEPHHGTNVFESIESITPCEHLEDTYCFNEPLEHKGIFNGILTGNCTEILEYTDKDEIAVCNLASICLPQFVDTHSTVSFDHEKLHIVAQTITRNLNKVIDHSYYPVPQAERSNKRHRPIGIGVQGLADVYQLLGIEFDSAEAAQINEDIFETIYHGAMTASIELAKRDGPYETFEHSPLSKGQFQFDLWNATPKSNRYDWEILQTEVMKYGARNSLLLAPMPTATTSQIMGNNEAIEPYTSNLYLRRTVAGEFVVINKHLVKELRKLKLWNESMKNKIIYHEGSVQSIQEIPEHIKKVYKTAWELSQKVLIDQAADRGKYVCQSQSLNLFVPRPNLKILSSMHFYSWNKGLKTGIYYLRTKPAANAIQFTIDTNAVCESCSS